MNFKIKFLLIISILFLFTNVYAEKSVSDILEAGGHGVSRLTDKQNFELVVDRLIQNLHNAQYSTLRLVLDENYYEVNNKKTKSSAASN